MNLLKKKILVARTLKVGKGRIIFNTQRLNEIKEAITRQDIRELFKDGAISIREIKGRKKNIKRKIRRRAGSIKKTVSTRKRDYMNLTRKLRAYIVELKKHGTITVEKYRKLRKEIRASIFRSKAHFKEGLSE